VFNRMEQGSTSDDSSSDAEGVAAGAGGSRARSGGSAVVGGDLSSSTSDDEGGTAQAASKFKRSKNRKDPDAPKRPANGTPGPRTLEVTPLLLTRSCL